LDRRSHSKNAGENIFASCDSANTTANRFSGLGGKYGEENMVFAKIALCPITDLIAVEQAKINALKPEYNTCPIAGSTAGLRASDSARVKMSIAHQSRTPEHRKKLSLAAKRRFLVEKNPMLGRSGEKAPMWGKSHSLESLAKMSEKKKGQCIGIANGKSKAVICVELNMRFITGLAAQEWLRINGSPKATAGNISKACTGRYAKAYGFTWQRDR
jgi:group I intron endonuclease